MSFSWLLLWKKRPPTGGFFISNANLYVRVKTIVYIDGYNLYYGRLTQTSYKWLDVVKLFTGIVTKQDPTAEIVKTRYFTAPALAKFARRGQESVIAQQSYHRALVLLHQEEFSITFGLHTCAKATMPCYVEDVPPNKVERVNVWQIVEKKTDVNLAMAMYRDAVKGLCDQMVLCSNDSDAEPVLAAIRSDFPAMKIGVVAPLRPVSGGQLEERRPSKDLSSQAHWTRRLIHDEELQSAQLPSILPTKKKPIRKPAHW